MDRTAMQGLCPSVCWLLLVGRREMPKISAHGLRFAATDAGLDLSITRAWLAVSLTRVAAKRVSYPGGKRRPQG